MPAVKYYVVTQAREVKVTANSPEEAIRIGAAAFNNGQNRDNGVIDGPEGVWGNSTSAVIATGMSVREE